VVHSAPLLRVFFAWDSEGAWNSEGALEDRADELARVGEVLDDGINAMMPGRDRRRGKK
jgi:hypothetical protein